MRSWPVREVVRFLVCRLSNTATQVESQPTAGADGPNDSGGQDDGANDKSFLGAAGRSNKQSQEFRASRTNKQSREVSA
jgi:hypothetical protein